TSSHTDQQPTLGSLQSLYRRLLYQFYSYHHHLAKDLLDMDQLKPPLVESLCCYSIICEYV
ncbi:MAG: hypothetical protein LC127_04005, partial [Chitinophagales bacterium]|nr:hypothetical protein [Chitinophagales bacterium]